jgi:UDP-N-acetylmuramate dehydrogenase
MTIEENIQLGPFTTFGIGGRARYFARVQSMVDLYDALDFAAHMSTKVGKEVKTFVLGGGSNILVNDSGFDGLVIKIELKGIDLLREEEGVLLVAAAGESWEGVVMRAVSENIWGIENLAGIPGTVGGAVVQNIGAYGAALSQTLEWVEVYDTEKR